MSKAVREPTAIERELTRSPAVAAALEALGEDREGLWVVGGAVRDAARGAEVRDVDLATWRDPADIARRLAGSSAHPFELSEEFSTWRTVARDGGWKIDVAALRAPTIEEDLGLRDLTVNAMAVPLAGGELLDPAGGLADLADGTLRPAGPASFAEDPIRVLRAARFGAALELRPDPETVALARDQAAQAAEAAGERQFAELRAMLTGPDPVGALSLLEELGATPHVLPELEALRGVEQSANHHLDTYEHTVEVLRRLLAVEADPGEFAGDVAPEVDSYLRRGLGDEMTRWDALRFAAVLHDIGKPATRTVTGEFVGFRGHDRVGAEMIAALCRRMRTSRRLTDHLAALTRHHLVLGFMVRERPLPPRRIWDYLKLTGPVAIDVTVLTIADRLSAQGGGVPEAAIQGHLELAREMLEEAVRLEREGPPPILLRGDELAGELGIDPGPELGAAVEELEAASYAGEVSDRDAAIAHLRAWLDSR